MTCLKIVLSAKLSQCNRMSEEFVEEFVKVESIFVRQRNCLMLRAKFAPIFTDYYLHLMQHGLKNEDPYDTMLRDLLAYFTLYLVSRPWAEQHAWTINIKDPVLANIFVTGSSLTESVVGRIFTDDVKAPEYNTMYSTLLRDGAEPRNSVVRIHGETPAQWVEDFYNHSEQRPGRCFELPDECFCLITAQPDADLEWLESLTPEMVGKIEEMENTRILETRKFAFNCGCTLDRILPTLKTLHKNKEDLLQGDDSIKITCPRCAAVYEVSKENLED